MNDKNKKPQLHQSHLQMLYRCGYKFSRVVIDGEREPSTTPLVVGTATHSAVARNLNNKIEKGTLLTKEAVRDFSRDDFVKTWQESQIVLNEEEMADGLQLTKDKLQDETIQLVTEHHYELAPKIFPKAVERKWVLTTTDDFKFDLAGMIDIDEERKIVRANEHTPVTLSGIRDTKTRKRNLGQKEVDTSEQYTMYALAKSVLDGKIPDYVTQDNLVKPTKTQPAKAISYTSTRTKDDFDVLFRRISQAERIITAGIYTPANPSDWWCSKDFCGFAANGSCPYFNSKSRQPITNQTKENKDDREKSKSIIDDLTSTLEREKE